MRLNGLSSRTIISSLDRTTKDLSTTMERLSSGFRINRASDDAAGLAISESLRVKARIFRQALLNANDGISFTNIQNGALSQLTAILQRQQELAEQAANGTYSSQQRKALDAEAMELSDEFNRIIATTQFNGINVFSTAAQTTLAVGESTQDTLTLPQLSMGGTAGSSSWDGTFSAAQGLTLAGGNVAFPVPADLDGDGDLDVIAGNATGSYVQPFYNRGDGQFTAGSTYATPSAPMAVQGADFNGDGKLDMVTKNSSGSTSVLLANGSGGYTRTDYGAGLGNFGEVHALDLNGDGKSDYVTFGITQVGIFINSGTGSFTPSYINPGYSPGLAVGDVNGDGAPDLVISNDAAGTSQVYRNQGNGSFVGGAGISGIAGNSGSIGDVNGDGINDLVFSGWTQTRLQVALGIGNGTFQAAQSFTHGCQTNQLSLIDINGDRNLDVLMSGYSSNSVLTYLNQGNGQFVSSSATSALSSSWGVTAADLNGDAVLDIISGNWGPAVLVSFGGNRSSNLPYFDLRTASSAAKSLDGIKSRLDQLGILTGQLGAVQSRIETAANLLAVKKDLLHEADSRIRSADFADEAAKHAALAIKQQTAGSLLGGVKAQETAIVRALLAF